MSKTVVRKNESLDDALRRFKRSVTKAGTLQEARKREHYEKPWCTPFSNKEIINTTFCHDKTPETSIVSGVW